MDIELENNDLKIMVRSKGAELRLLKALRAQLWVKFESSTR